MDIHKYNEQAKDFILTPSDVESAIRQFICTTHPEYDKGWLLNPKYNIGAVVFAGTKK